MHGIADDDAMLRGRILTFEMRIQCVHLEQAILALDACSAATTSETKIFSFDGACSGIQIAA